MSRTRNIMFILAIGAALIRVAGVGDRAFWLDELYSLSEACGVDPTLVPIEEDFTQQQLVERSGWAEVKSSLLATDGGNGSLYIMLLRLWTDLFGIGPWGLRSMSVLFGVCVVILIHALAEQLFPTAGTAHWAAALAAVSPFLVLYSGEARGYMLATALGLTSTLCFLRLLDSSPQRRILHAATYGAASLAMLFSHYSALCILLGHALLAALYLRDRRTWSLLIIGGGAVGAVVLLWMATDDWAGPRTMAERNASYITQLESSTWFEVTNPRSVITGLLSQFSWSVGTAPHLLGVQLRWALLIMVIPALCLLPLLPSLRKPAHRRSLVILLVLGFAAMAYALALALVSGHTIAFQPLYAIFSVPYIIVLLAYGIREHWLSNSGARRASVIGFGAVALWGVCGTQRDLRQVGSHRAGMEALVIGQALELPAFHDAVLLYNATELVPEMNLLLAPSATSLTQRVEFDLPAQVALRVGDERTGRLVVIRALRGSP